MGANLALADHEAQGYPDRTTASCVDNRGARGRAAADAPFAKGQGIGGGNAPDAREYWGPPQSLTLLQSED